MSRGQKRGEGAYLRRRGKGMMAQGAHFLLYVSVDDKTFFSLFSARYFREKRGGGEGKGRMPYVLFEGEGGGEGRGHSLRSRSLKSLGGKRDYTVYKPLVPEKEKVSQHPPPGFNLSSSSSSAIPQGKRLMY